MLFQNNRVAVTGIGTICGLGHNLNDVWGNIVKGKSGISTIENVDAEKYSVKIAGEVKNFELSEEILPAKERSRFDKFIHYSLHSAYEAYKNAGLDQEHSYSPDRMGCIFGVGMGGFPIIEDTCQTYYNKGPRRVSPFFIPAIIPNMSSGMVTLKLGLKGTNYSISSACASSSHAISAACFEVASGRHDVMITGGAESVITDLPIAGFSNMKALSKRNDDPARASRPFDTARDGFVMGEGAGILILENYEKAKARGATIYAEIVGHGSSSDAHHITAPHPDGAGAIQCMRQALSTAALNPSDIGYINTHGTSTPLGDIAETQAIKETFGDHAKNLYISSTKSMVGHLLGAAGGIEAIFSIMALHTGIIPPTINLDDQDPKCDLNYVPNKAIKEQVDYALSNSFGFGGTNSSVIFKRNQD